MNYFAKMPETPDVSPSHLSFTLLTAANGCVNGCVAGISDYITEDFSPPAFHEDQEGFYVISGNGWARIGEQEQQVSAGDVFIAPAHVAHSMRTLSKDVPLRILWFHAAV